MGKLLFEEETFAIRKAVFDVYREMGAGFLEEVYQECLEKELNASGIPFQAKPELTVHYKGQTLQNSYIPDFICHDQIILELVAIKEILPEHQSQILNFLRAANIKVALLINFGSHPKVQIERFVL